MYLGAELSNITSAGGQECWAMSYDKYCTEAVTNVESVFGKALFKVAVEVCYPSEI